MAVAVTNTIANDGAAWPGMAESFEDMIFDISPTGISVL